MSSDTVVGEILKPFSCGFFRTRDGRIAFASRNDSGSKILGKIGEKGLPSSWYLDGRNHRKPKMVTDHDLVEYLPDCTSFDQFNRKPGDWVEIVKPGNASTQGWASSMDEIVGAVYEVARIQDNIVYCKGSSYSFLPQWTRVTDKPFAMSVFSEIRRELNHAIARHPTWPTDPMHALAVLGEEFGELTKDVVQHMYEPSKTTIEDIRNEAIQTAAMAVRFLASIDKYDFSKSSQHHQSGLLVEEKYVDELASPAIEILTVPGK